MVNIQIIKIGHLPFELDLKKITDWNSKVFKVSKDVRSFGFNLNADLDGWGYSDQAIISQFPVDCNSDFQIAIVNFPIEDNWYSRRIAQNKIVFSFHEIKEFLERKNIPLENAILRVLYGYTLLYKRSGNRIPGLYEGASFTHDETRGCLFDMNGIKSDLTESCDSPIICLDCEASLERERVSIDDISCIKNEISKIDKPMYYKLVEFAKVHPIGSILLSGLFAMVLNVVSSCIYDSIGKKDCAPVVKKSDS